MTRKSMSTAARFMRGEDPIMLAEDRCARLNCTTYQCRPCPGCIEAIWETLRRTLRKRR